MEANVHIVTYHSLCSAYFYPVHWECELA